MAEPSLSGSRDAGLVRRIGPWGLIAAFVGTLLGSGIFNVPAAMAGAVGSYAPLAYLACGLAVGAVMICIAEGVSRVPTAGGIAGFVAVAFGPFWGFFAGAFNYVSALLACAAVAAGAADVIGTAAPAMAGGPVRAVAIIGWFALLAAINIAGVGVAARFVTIATGVKLVPVVLLVAAGAWFIDGENLSLAMPDGGAQIGRAALLGIFLFTGLESSLAVAGEVRDPARTIPRALIIAFLGYAAVCVAVQLVVQGLLGDATALSKAPLAEAAGQIAPWLGAVVGAGAAVSMLGYTVSDSLSSPRMLFGLSRDGFLPLALGRTHRRTHAPWVASVAHAAIAAGLAISGSFAALAILATLVAVLIYLIGCAGAVKLRAAGVAHAGPPVRIPGLHALATAGSGAMVWVAFQCTMEEALAVAALIAVALLLYRLRRC